MRLLGVPPLLMFGTCLVILGGDMCALCQEPVPGANRSQKMSARATPKPRMQAADVRQRTQSQLTRTGISYEPWTKNASAVFARWKTASLKAEPGVVFSELRCFRSGCIATATYSDMTHYLQLSDAFSNSEEFQSWPGMKYRSPPELLPGGHVAADWILFRPEEREKK